MVIEDNDHPMFDDSRLGRIQREIFEAGRFAMQTNDPQNASPEHIRAQHEALMKDKVAAAKVKGRRVGFSDPQIHALYWQGARHYLRQRNRTPGH